jgi:hypothetical protein
MRTQEGRARAEGSRESRKSAAPSRKPSLARAEIVDKATRARLESELDAALKRRPAHEAKLAGALRAIGALSPALRASMAEAVEVMLRRGSFGRELYGSSLRTLAEAEDKHTPALLRVALANALGDVAGGSATLSAACFSREPSLAGLLAKIASSQKAHLAFGAETARVVRRESNGAHLSALAPMIKESHRISLCVELFVPLARAAPVPLGVASALNVLRGAERHLGRWLVLADVAAKAGDEGPVQEARAKSAQGPASARAAWSLVAWALTESAASVRSATPELASVEPPQTRPTVELVARLSDRPSADRDTTFLFRMARARAAAARPMLEVLASSGARQVALPSVDTPRELRRTGPLTDEVAIRAALYLARDHDREDMREALIEAAMNTKREELRGLAAAALWDLGVRDRARAFAEELVTSRSIGNVAWGALVRAAAARATSGARGGEEVLSETPFRWIQCGWLE